MACSNNLLATRIHPANPCLYQNVCRITLNPLTTPLLSPDPTLSPAHAAHPALS
jgi:hypothetical protein